MRKPFVAILLLVGLSLASACGGPATSNGRSPTPITPPSVSATGAQQITVEVANGVRFEPDSIVLQAGQQVELSLRNGGRIPHDFVLTKGVAQPVHIVAASGQTATDTFTLDQPGTYPFICSVPGHEAAGMKGTITAR